jgi:hypothetical protein
MKVTITKCDVCGEIVDEGSLEYYTEVELYSDGGPNNTKRVTKIMVTMTVKRDLCLIHKREAARKALEFFMEDNPASQKEGIVT